MPSRLRAQARKHVPEARKPRMKAADLSRHLVQAQEEERRRISRELHDGTGQGLMVLRLYLAMLASESQPAESQLKIQEALKLLDHTIEDLRRIVGRLSPRALEEVGLVGAIRKEIVAISRNTGIRAQWDFPAGLGEIDRETEIALYRSFQEALHNIAKHSQAGSFFVRILTGHGSVCLEVEDDGIGFSGKRIREKSFGLQGMKERITALGGKVSVQSQPGKGTRIKIKLPLPETSRRQWGHSRPQQAAMSERLRRSEPGEASHAPGAAMAARAGQ